MANATAAPSIHVFGVRHLSPAGAWHLRRFLDRIRPKVVLIEGLADAGDLIQDMTRRESVPPIAILAYTETLPVRTLVYPLARYSPEYQALLWAKENRATAQFIDLPAENFLALQDQTAQPDDARSEAHETQDAASPRDRVSVYDQFAQQSGEPDYETYWERRFEHNLSHDSYRLAAFEFGKGLRELESDTPLSQAENLVREAYMRRRIQEVVSAGHAPESIVAVVGAYHASVLSDDHTAMTDDELESLPRRSSKLTLMPYSYFKLSSQSGYGAGNHAPAYFELLWHALENQDLDQLPSQYLAQVARHLRDEGTHRSTAEVIEATRLASTLSALREGHAPTLVDLQDAAITLMGHGERSTVNEALARVEVGTDIGQLPQGVSKTSIQDDFERELQRVKLTKYRSTVRQDLQLDLRENRRVQSESAAFLDLSRSAFLHRLRILEIPFAEPVATHQQSTTWAELWHLQWSPESEIRLVESVLLGETVQLAAAYQFKSKLDECNSIADAARMVRDACQCGMIESMDRARSKLQQLAAENTDFVAISKAAHELGMVVRYGDVRRFDPQPLLPLLEDLFVQGCLALKTACNCDDDAAKSVRTAMDELNRVCLEHHDRVEEPLWMSQLQVISDADDLNPLLSGYACAILLEQGLVSNDQLGREVSRRLSPGIAADLGAGWFEGVASRNRYSLLARQAIWEQLASYVQSLDEQEFRRALVFLRRAFGSFSPQEKRHITENLAEYWGANRDQVSEAIEQPLTEQQQQQLEDLNEFDFDDL